ncbi:tyrosine-protein phosphatase non-receptor type 18 [Talpa occidentalis]|uniref:tyrosine-protein phosphatase non-receptor type 18 n=1 Tax=Talpa occidentalis TaxID=50954 RepID=UPI0023F7DD86|nr:tyrosine-protein phosphatase non-receptor type 18 [Talpa occidentalis]
MSRSWEAARSFVERLEARGGGAGAGLAGEFSDIRARQISWKADNVYPANAGCQPENVKKNRYKDVVPYDQTRVILSLLREEGHSDYINGNFIRGTDGSQAYIATQGPLPNTLLDFWRLVWEFGVKVILMACREVENGQKKCERYWAQEQKPLQIGLFYITLKKEKWVNADIILRTLQVTFQKESRRVYQLQYMSWPDRGVPSHPEHVLTMVEEAHRLQGSGPCPPLCVHCSAGCGRTGVLCTVDYVRQLLLTQTIPPNFSLFDVVLNMRTQRPSFVQTEEQYRFLHHTVSQMFLSALQNATPHNQNLKENRAPLYEAGSPRPPPDLLANPRPIGGVLRYYPHAYPKQRPAPPAVPRACPQPAGRQSREPRRRRPPPSHPPPARGAEGGSGGCSPPPAPAPAPARGLTSSRPQEPPSARAGPRHGRHLRVGAEARGPGGGGAGRGEALYSQVTPRALRAPARAGDESGAPPSRVPAERTPAAASAYEDVANGAPSGGLGFNLRIGKPKGPRDPPAEWSRV